MIITQIKKLVGGWFKPLVQVPFMFMYEVKFVIFVDGTWQRIGSVPNEVNPDCLVYILSCDGYFYVKLLAKNEYTFAGSVGFGHLQTMIMKLYIRMLHTGALKVPSNVSYTPMHCNPGLISD